MERRPITVTVAFETSEAARVFVGRVTHAFNLSCTRNRARVTLDVAESSYDALVNFARAFGGEPILV